MTGSEAPLAALDLLRRSRLVDLTHSFHPGIPHCPSFAPEQRTLLHDYDSSGFLAHEYRFAGQWGTHVDPPVHFVQGGRCIDDIPPAEMLLPLVVLDVHSAVVHDHDYCVRPADLQAWESAYGPVPAGAFVALRTDWSARWPSQEAMLNADSDGTFHYPGWSLEVLRLLIEERGIGACGHETPDTDPGTTVSSGDAPLERYVLEQDRYQIELLAHLDQVPAVGAVVIASWPKAARGSGFPARVIAVCPGED